VPPESPTDSTYETTRYFLQLALALEETAEPDVKRELIDRAHDTMHELSAEWIQTGHVAPDSDPAPYVETLIQIRNKLRDAKQYTLADEIRDRLAELDIVLEDGSAGTKWRKGAV
jgi:cysteinyl-tRNA synthetase